jgi:hypothetical protein
MPGCSAIEGGRRRSRKMRGGNLPSFSVDPALGSAGAGVGSANLSGRAVELQTAGRRRRTRRTRRRFHRRGTRKIRGGAIQSANVGYGFTGTGEKGIANFDGYSPNQGGVGVTSV